MVTHQKTAGNWKSRVAFFSQKMGLYLGLPQDNYPGRRPQAPACFKYGRKMVTIFHTQWPANQPRVGCWAHRQGNSYSNGNTVLILSSWDPPHTQSHSPPGLYCRIMTFWGLEIPSLSFTFHDYMLGGPVPPGPIIGICVIGGRIIEYGKW